MTFKAAGDGCGILDHPERAFRRRGGLTRVAYRAGGLARPSVPGDAVFEESIAKPADRRDRLYSSSEGPLDQSLNPVPSPRNGNLDAAGRARVGVFDSRALAKRPRGHVHGESSLGGPAKSRRVVRNRLGAEFGGMAIPASLWSGKRWSGGEQKQ